MESFLDAERVGDVAVLLARVVLVVFHDRGQQNTDAEADADPW